MKIRTMAAAACLIVGAVLGGAGSAMADSEAHGIAAGSPGFLSGNLIQVPIHVPINACGNSVNVIGLLNPTAGNVCFND
ncbi:chaplin [Streptomyces sp. CJ_13]|uniref:chaplin n=1 Tax=Streptomyces TaxID=1883 RepID=UPI000F4376C8|nr:MULTISPECIES: chaplin [unclassified Streptomyces]AYV31573.1 hypothetical protein EES41_33050 [Streptomyces sp. ADI95-16]MBT1187797.1 chaplin [Streptomyces sp. CJ_13]